MNNPHAERQAVLLERIGKNAVRRVPFLEDVVQFTCTQEKCTELILELNHCVEVCPDTRRGSMFPLCHLL